MTSLQTESRAEQQRYQGAPPHSDRGFGPAGADEPPIEGGLAQAISEAAYHLAAARGFEPGHELDDWIAAEKLVAEHRDGLVSA